jgi:molecular chaperone GrpE
MSGYNNPYGRRRATAHPPAGAGGRPRPTLDDYQALAQAYRQLQAEAEQQRQELAAARRAVSEHEKSLAEQRQKLEITQEALQRQNADLKQLEAELVWSKAALQQQDRAATQDEGAEGKSWRERYMRLQAEVENLRRRWEQRYTTELAEARHAILRDMLPLADHLELAMRHSEMVEGEQAQDFVSNIATTRQAFLETLRRYGVEPIGAEGQTFDPNLHEAVGQVHDANVPEGAIAQVVQTGYRAGDKLVRPARVLVSGQG